MKAELPSLGKGEASGKQRHHNPVSGQKYITSAKTYHSEWMGRVKGVSLFLIKLKGDRRVNSQDTSDSSEKWIKFLLTLRRIFKVLLSCSTSQTNCFHINLSKCDLSRILHLPSGDVTRKHYCFVAGTSCEPFNKDTACSWNRVKLCLLFTPEFTSLSVLTQVLFVHYPMILQIKSQSKEWGPGSDCWHFLSCRVVGLQTGLRAAVGVWAQ